jgi:site-specific DNA-methyltransferase (adenine-specific)
MKFELNNLYNMDCMEAMKDIPDKYFELAIVDPPYGGGQTQESAEDLKDTKKNNWESQKRSRFGGIFDKYHISATRTGGMWGNGKDIEHWDVAPPDEYFEELFRVSRNQIIWGGNYFDLPPTRCFLIWRKLTISENFSMAMAEYAWTSLNANAKVFEYAPQDKNRFHPTQKPKALYKWILEHYAEKGDKILDTHAGSCSLAIACYEMGHDWLAFELDEDYYQLAQERIKRETAQVNMFNLGG